MTFLHFVDLVDWTCLSGKKKVKLWLKMGLNFAGAWQGNRLVRRRISLAACCCRKYALSVGEERYGCSLRGGER